MKKKVLAVILGAVMVASMAGCGGSDTKTTDAAATETTDSTDDAESTETAEATDGRKLYYRYFPVRRARFPG